MSSVLDDLKKCACGLKPSRTPLMPLGLSFNKEWALLSYHDYRMDVDKIVDINSRAVEYFGYDWILVFPDDYVEWGEFGLEFQDVPSLPSAASKYLALTPAQVKALKHPAAENTARMPLQLQCLRRLKNQWQDSLCIGGRVPAPFSAMALLFGVEAVLLAALENSQLLREGMKRLTDFIIDVGKVQRYAGADLLWIGDCLAGSAFVSEQLCAELAILPARNTVAALRETGVFQVYHSAEKSVPHIELQCQVGADAVNLGEGVSFAQIRRRIGNAQCLMGNLDPVSIVRDSSLEEITTHTRKMIERNAALGPYIFSTSEGITDSTKPENVKAMMDAALGMAQ